MKKNYIETKVYTTSMGAESVEALLLRHGISGVSIADPSDARDILNAKEILKWDYVDSSIEEDAKKKSGEVVLSFYTVDDAEGMGILSEFNIEIMKLKSDEQYGEYGKNADFGRLYVVSTPLISDWENSWKDSFVTFHASSSFVVRPPWEEYTGDYKSIVINPGMVFGIGTHETTSMCIAALEKEIEARQEDPLSAKTDVNENLSVLDVGTGTGILAIVAAMLGANPIVAMEYDSEAVVSAASNLEANGVADKIDLIEGNILKLDEMKADGKFNYGEHSFDVIVANLVSGLIKAILPELAKLIKPGGRLILSGLLASETDEMFYEVGLSGFKNIETEIKGEWLSICADL